MNDIDHGTDDWDVTYPTGRRFKATGRLVVGLLPGCGDKPHPVVFDPSPKGPVFVLDPRAVIRNTAGTIVYLGRDEY